MVRLGLVFLALIALGGCVVYDPGPPVAAAPPPPPAYYYAPPPPAYYYSAPTYYAAPSVGVGFGFSDHHRHW
jgi:hypothetical protein